VEGAITKSKFLISNIKNLKGFTLVEIVVDIAIIGLVAAAVLTAYSASFRTMELAKAKIAAVALANERMEEYRNMPYDKLATQNGPIYPPGDILDNQEFQRKGVRYNVHTIISYVDDPFDGNAEGTISGKPKDLYPYDYKKIDITVSKIGRSGYLSRITSNMAAKAAETPSNSGIIKICVIDSASIPVPDAVITITNPNVNPPVNISATVGSDGCIMVPNLPPTTHNSYHITATIDGFSTDMTYPRTPQNPNALQPDVDVSIQEVTPQTLVIDRLSTLVLDFVDENGAPIPNLGFHLQGAKRMWFNPDTFKYSADLTTDANGHLELQKMEFDDYTVSIPGRYIVSSIPYQPIGLKANTTLTAKIIATTNPSLPRIAACDPITGKVGETVSPVITGENFQTGATVKLISGATEIVGTGVVISKGNTIEVDFNLAGATAGFYDILITNPDGNFVRQEKGMEIKNQ